MKTQHTESRKCYMCEVYRPKVILSTEDDINREVTTVEGWVFRITNQGWVDICPVCAGILDYAD